MTHFYIITFDGQIFEIIHTQEKFNATINAWNTGQILILKELGGGIHGNSISKVLNEENYESYTFAVKPKLFIKDGTWYDGHERKVIRREKWKEDELDDKLKLAEPIEIELSPEERKQLFEKYRPEFMKKSKEIVPPHDPELIAKSKTYYEN